MTHIKQKNQSVETDWEVTQMIELVDKDDKITIINKYYIYKKVEKNMTKKERKDIKRPKLKF